MRYINAHEGDYIRAGEALIDGNINPHDILAVLGVCLLAVLFLQIKAPAELF